MNKNERMITHTAVGQKLFERGTVIIPNQAGDIVVACQQLEKGEYRYRVRATQNQENVWGSSGVTRETAYMVLPIGAKREIFNALRKELESE